jgi:hypothetical protein
LSKAQRTAVGGYLVNVAAADGVVTDAEHKALKKLYRRLKLDEQELQELVSESAPADRPVEVRPKKKGRQGEKIPAAETSGLTINRERLREIQEQTAEVASILTEAMATEEADTEDEQSGSGPQATATSTPPDTATASVQFRPSGEAGTAVADPDADAEGADVPELDSRLEPFLKAVLAHGQWSRTALREVADDHHLMLAGAIDGINEWSEERFGDRLIEEDGDTFYVDQTLMETTE